MLCLSGFELYSSWVPLVILHLYGGPQLSRQNQKPHGKNKIPHGKTKTLTAKTKYLTAKPNTSQQKQSSFGFAVGICFWREVFGFCCEVFGFAVTVLVLS